VVGGAVEIVGADGVADGVELDADLVFAAGVEGAAEVGEFAGFIDGDGLVIEFGDLAGFHVGGDFDIFGDFIFEEEVFEGGGGFLGDAVDDDVVLAGDGVVEELFFEGGEGVDIAGEDEESGGVAVEAVDEVELGFLVFAFDVFGEDFEDGGAEFLGVGGGEESGGFEGDEEVAVFVDDFESFVEFLGFHGDGGGVDEFEFVGGVDGLFEGFDGCGVEVDAFVFDPGAEGIAFGLGVEGDEAVENGRGFGSGHTMRVCEWGREGERREGCIMEGASVMIARS